MGQGPQGLVEGARGKCQRHQRRGLHRLRRGRWCCRGQSLALLLSCSGRIMGEEDGNSWASPPSSSFATPGPRATRTTLTSTCGGCTTSLWRDWTCGCHFTRV
jgi:hypothetical protein